MSEYSDRKHFTNTIKHLLEIVQVAIDYKIDDTVIDDKVKELRIHQILRYMLNGNRYIDQSKLCTITFFDSKTGNARFMSLDSTILKTDQHTIRACHMLVPFLYYNLNSMFRLDSYNDYLVNYVIECIHNEYSCISDIYYIDEAYYKETVLFKQSAIALKIKDKLLNIYNMLESKNDIIIPEDTTNLF